jgi:stress-induced morphogen
MKHTSHRLTTRNNNSPKNSETHFKVLVVSEAFDGTVPLARHRQVNSILADELAGPVHALSIVAKTPAQWQHMQDGGLTKLPPSPNCQGGDGSLPKKH